MHHDAMTSDENCGHILQIHLSENDWHFTLEVRNKARIVITSFAFFAVTAFCKCS